MECLKRYGVRKTTVEQLTGMAGISKGSFYSFYDSKELLMFEVIDEFGRPIQQKFGEKLRASGQDARQIADALYGMCIATKSSFIVDLVKNDEFDYLMRKLPEKAVIKGFELDNTFIEQYFTGFLRADIDPATVLSGMTMLYSTMMHIEWYPAGQYEKALKLLIDAFIDEIIKK